MRQDPFARAVRVDKLTIAALTATLELYRIPENAIREIPTLSMIAATPEAVRQRCQTLSSMIAERGIESEVCFSVASVGAGAYPTTGIASFSVFIKGDPEALQRKLRSASQPVIGRINEGKFGLDLRSVPERFDDKLAQIVAQALA